MAKRKDEKKNKKGKKKQEPEIGAGSGPWRTPRQDEPQGVRE